MFVIPAPHQVWDKLKQESSNIRLLWTPALAGVTLFLTFLRVYQFYRNLFYKRRNVCD